MRNLTMLTDLYQLTMMYGYFKKGMVEDKAIFDVFFRKGAGESEYAIVAGLEPVSYTHLDVYKRQGLSFSSLEKKPMADNKFPS